VGIRNFSRREFLIPRDLHTISSTEYGKQLQPLVHRSGGAKLIEPNNRSRSVILIIPLDKIIESDRNITTHTTIVNSKVAVIHYRWKAFVKVLLDSRLVLNTRSDLGSTWTQFVKGGCRQLGYTERGGIDELAKRRSSVIIQGIIDGVGKLDIITSRNPDGTRKERIGSGIKSSDRRNKTELELKGKFLLEVPPRGLGHIGNSNLNSGIALNFNKPDYVVVRIEGSEGEIIVRQQGKSKPSGCESTGEKLELEFDRALPQIESIHHL
jgi:hypothetical protein